MQFIECKQFNGKLAFRQTGCYESRGHSVERLVAETVKKNGIKKDFYFVVNTDDVPNINSPEIKIFNFSCQAGSYHNGFPDYLYDKWSEIGINDYKALTDEISCITEPAELNKVGWIGSAMTHQRKSLVRIANENQDFCEAIEIKWNRENPSNLPAGTAKYMTIQDQVKRWKYLIDLGGVGWSARLKALMCSTRIVFIAERKFGDWFFEFMQPWVHYVPVSFDLSDLEANYRKIEADVELQNFIQRNKADFARKYCTREAAYNRISELILNNF